MLMMTSMSAGISPVYHVWSAEHDGLPMTMNGHNRVVHLRVNKHRWIRRSYAGILFQPASALQMKSDATGIE